MTFDQLVELINEHYPGTLMANVHSGGDGLARFIYDELEETFEPSDTPEQQIGTAIAKLETAIQEMKTVQTRLKHVRTKRKQLSGGSSNHRAKR